MLKWAKGSKHGGHGPGHHGSAARVSLADLRRASAKLLRRKDSSLSKSKSHLTDPIGSPVASPATKTGAATSSAAEEDGSSSPPPPLVPPRGSSVASMYGGSTVIRTPTPASSRSTSIIKQATVRRMSTLRQARSSNDDSRRQPKRPGSSSSSSSSTCSSSRMRRKPMDTTDNNSSLYMQLDKIPVAVSQQVSTSASGSVLMAAAHLKRKALEDISNQAYRQIIHSLQDELAQMSDDAEAEAQSQSRADSADETRTLAEATLLPMNRNYFISIYLKKETSIYGLS